MSRLWDVADFPVQYAHGVLNRDCGVSPAEFRKPLDTTGFRVLKATPAADGVGLGRALIEVRQASDGPSSAVVQYEFDLDKESAVVESMIYAMGRPMFGTHIDHQHTEYGWLPRCWAATMFKGNGEVSGVTEFEVTHYAVDVDVENSQFTVAPQSGDVVLSLEGVRYRVQSDGSLVPLTSHRPRGGIMRSRRFGGGGHGNSPVVCCWLLRHFKDVFQQTDSRVRFRIG